MTVSCSKPVQAKPVLSRHRFRTSPSKNRCHKKPVSTKNRQKTGVKSQKTGVKSYFGLLEKTGVTKTGVTKKPVSNHISGFCKDDARV
jgi:hypothetical protein